MKTQEYLKIIDSYNIRKFGFDTHARVLGLDKEVVKDLWNDGTNGEFKRFPRTEYTMRFMPELSTLWKPYWKMETPNDYLMFYITPTAPIIVPNNFITDKGSIPFIFRNIVAHDDREMMLAYMMHDRSCEVEDMTRFSTDGLLYEVGTELGASWIKKNGVYTAVRSVWFRSIKDKIVNGQNISKYNRDLIQESEAHFMEVYYPSHVNILEELKISRAKI